MAKKRTGCSAFATPQRRARKNPCGARPATAFVTGSTLFPVLPALLVADRLADDEPADEAKRLRREGPADAAVERRAGPFVVAAERARGEHLRDRERGRDPVPGIARPVDDVRPGGERADDGEPVCRSVDRPSPRVRHRDVLRRRHELHELLFELTRLAPVVVEVRVDAAPEREPSAAAPECHSPIPGRAVVVNEQAAVGDRLAAGPAALLQLLRHRLRRDHVARNRHDGARELGNLRRPRVQREHDGFGVDAARRRANHTVLAVELEHRCAFVDPDALLGGDPSQAAGEECRLHDRSGLLVCSREVDRRARALLHLLGAQKLIRMGAVRSSGLDAGLPRAHLRGRGRCPEPAALMKVRVHALALAEGPDLPDRVLGSLGQPDGLLLTDPLDQRLDLRPPREGEAAVSP